MKPNLKSQRSQHLAAKRVKLQASALREFVETHKCAVEYIISMLDDFSNILPPKLYKSAELNLDKETVRSRFESEGLVFATMTLPKLSAGLFQYFETGVVSYPSYQIKKGTVHPVFLQGLFRLACSDGEYQVKAVEFIYQISVLFKKLKGPYADSVLIKQLDDFVAVDEALADIDLFDDVRLPILQQARAEVYALFKGFTLDNMKVIPRPGPGATNTKVAKHDRFRPNTLYTQIDNVFPYVEWFMVNPYDVVHQTKLFRGLYLNPEPAQRARMKYVFKTFGKARGICIEENEAQFLQQSLKRGMYDWIENSPITKGKINFTSQLINARLALAASLSLDDATIDMSEASDRVWRLVVSWLFQDTEIHDALMALSTKWIDFPPELGDRPSIKCNKFAPMGSGLCFPVMSVVHWALIRAMIELSQYPNGHKERVYVYGDDIIIPAEITEMVYTYLPKFGMKINTTKSYYRSYFRESCGIHAYSGRDITPIFIKSLPVKASLSVILSCIAVESQLYIKGYYKSASHMRAKIRQAMSGYDMPFVPSCSSILGFKRDNLVYPEFPGLVRQRYDSWMNTVQRVRVVRAKSDALKPPTEFESYLRYVCTNDHIKEVSGTPDENDFELVWHWAPCPETTKVEHQSDWLKSLRSIRTERSDRDKQGEKLYEKLHPGFKAVGEHVTRTSSTIDDSRFGRTCDSDTKCYPRRKILRSRSEVHMARIRSTHRITRRTVCRGCAYKVRCESNIISNADGYCSAFEEWYVCEGQ